MFAIFVSTGFRNTLILTLVSQLILGEFSRAWSSALIVRGQQAYRLIILTIILSVTCRVTIINILWTDLHLRYSVRCVNQTMQVIKHQNIIIVYIIYYHSWQASKPFQFWTCWNCALIINILWINLYLRYYVKLREPNHAVHKAPKHYNGIYHLLSQLTGR